MFVGTIKLKNMTNGNDSIHNSEQGTQDGLTKREYFAAMALQGILANGADSDTVWDYEVIGKHCVVASDALIKALNEQP